MTGIIQFRESIGKYVIWYGECYLPIIKEQQEIAKSLQGKDVHFTTNEYAKAVIEKKNELASISESYFCKHPERPEKLEDRVEWLEKALEISQREILRLRVRMTKEGLLYIDGKSE